MKLSVFILMLKQFQSDNKDDPVVKIEYPSVEGASWDKFYTTAKMNLTTITRPKKSKSIVLS